MRRVRWATAGLLVAVALVLAGCGGGEAPPTTPTIPPPLNLVGFPAASVPAGTSADGLPLGVQLAAAPGGEALLLSVARQLETLRPWPRHAPLEPAAPQPS